MASLKISSSSFSVFSFSIFNACIFAESIEAFVISASVNDSGSGRSGTLNTGSIALSGSISGPGYSWSTGSNGTVVFTGTTPGTYDIYYTIGSDISGNCPVQLTSNKARIRAIITPDCEFDFTVAFG